MLNFDFLEKDVGLVSPLCMSFREKYCACYSLLTDQISLPDCLHFLKNLALCVL